MNSPVFRVVQFVVVVIGLADSLVWRAGASRRPLDPSLRINGGPHLEYLAARTRNGNDVVQQPAHDVLVAIAPFEFSIVEHDPSYKLLTAVVVLVGLEHVQSYHSTSLHRSRRHSPSSDSS